MESSSEQAVDNLVGPKQGPRLSDLAHLEFITKRPTPPHQTKIFTRHEWRLQVNGASNNQGAGAGTIMVSLSGILQEHSLSLGFPASNTEAEYEALITGLK